MTSYATDLFSVAERLDERPKELLNGGAAAALEVLAESAEERDRITSSRGIDSGRASTLWDHATALLQSPEAGELFSVAAEAAVTLYSAAWVLSSDEVTNDDLLALM
jgi:hypothetical protein